MSWRSPYFENEKDETLFAVSLMNIIGTRVIILNEAAFTDSFNWVCKSKNSMEVFTLVSTRKGFPSCCYFSSVVFFDNNEAGQ